MEEDIEPTDAEVHAEPMLQLFRYKHLQLEPLRQTVRMYCQLARGLVAHAPKNAERTVALRKLRESKDCACTAFLWKA